MTTELPKPARVEPVTSEVVHGLIRGLTVLQAQILRLYDVDTRRGAGVLSRDSKCLWTYDGHRITLMISEGCLMGTVSSDPDPFLIPEEMEAVG